MQQLVAIIILFIRTGGTMTVPITYKQANKQTHNIQIQSLSTKFLTTQQAKMEQTLYV